LSFAFIIIGFGLFTLRDQHSPTGEWVVFQAIESVGLGIFLTTALPAVQVKLSDGDTAKATGVWRLCEALAWFLALLSPPPFQHPN
jgi:hypothetical protein